MEYRRQGSNFKTLLRQHDALHEFHVTNGQNTRDEITRTEGPNAGDQIAFCTLTPFIFRGSPNKFWLQTCHACVIATSRLG